MTATIATLNVSVEQIESDLRRGRTVQEIAQDWQEPVTNVLAVKRAMDARAAANGGAPRPPVAVAPVAAAGARPATSASTHDSRTATAAPAGLSVDALVAAAARSSSKRTQVLGVKLQDLATVVRERLADERTVAEVEEKRRLERERAAAEVERLEAQLREARAKLRPGRRGGSAVQRDAKPRTAAQLASLAGGRTHGEFPCRKESCDRVLTTAAARGSHERNCGGAS